MRKFFTLAAFTAISFFAHSQFSANVVIQQGGKNNQPFSPSPLSASTLAVAEDGSTANVTVQNANSKQSEKLILRDFRISIPEKHSIKSIQINVYGKVQDVNSGATIAPRGNIGTYTNGSFAMTYSSLEKEGVPFQTTNNSSSLIWFSDGFSGLTKENISSQNFAIEIYLLNTNNKGTATAVIDEVTVIVTSQELSTLPVNFISFDAKSEANGTKLTWKVADQIDVLRYDVERSTNGNNFTKIGEVSAADVTTYTFTDKQPAQGTVFYRVKNVDVDGKFKYSTIVSIRNGASAIVLKAFPTPAKNNVTLQHASANAQTIIRLSAHDGRQVATIRPAAGTMQTSINLSAYAPGLYLISFDNGNGQVETLKVVKQ